jgi:hypothetical protein
MEIQKLLSLIKKAGKGITLIRAIYALVIILLAISAAWGWFKKPQTITVPQKEYVYVPKIKEVIKVKTEYVTVEKGQIQVLNKAEVIKKLKGLPQSVIDDKNKEITSTGIIPPHKSNTNVINVIDKKSGISEIIAKQEPLSFIAIEQDRYAGVRIGSTGQVTGFAEWNVLRVGQAHAGAYIQYGTKDGGEIGIQAKIEF